MPLDQYDLEAEREGSALSKSFKLISRGKRIIKIRRMHATGDRIQQTKAERRHVWKGR